MVIDPDPRNVAFGLDTNVMFGQGEIPLEVVGCVKYMDEEGNTEFAVFSTHSLSHPEAYGMTEMQAIALRDALDTTIYLAMEEDWDADD